MSSTLIFENADGMTTGQRYTRDPAEIASLSFMSDGDIFISYSAGDCDIARPYVTFPLLDANSDPTSSLFIPSPEKAVSWTLTAK